MRLLPLVGLLACAGCLAEQEETLGESRAWVLFDEDTVLAGHAIEQGDWTGVPRLPTEIDAEQPLILHGPRGDATEIETSADELVHVRGGVVERLRVEALDRLWVRGDRQAMLVLAEMLDAELEGDALVAEDLWERASFLEPPAGIDEVMPEPGEAALPTGGTIVVGHGEEAAALVGVYRSQSASLHLDAAGGFTLYVGCDVDVGRFTVEDGQVTLIGDRLSWTFASEAGRLVGGDHVVFTAEEAVEAEEEEAP